MIEPRVIVPEGKRSGAIYGAYTKGEFVKISGSFSTAQVTSLNTGQASAGEIMLVRCTGGTADNKTHRAFPIDKLIFAHENAETTYDTLSSGDRVIFYTEGEFATNCYNVATTSGGTALGSLLYINTTGWLSVYDTGTSAVGEPVAVLTGTATVGTDPNFDGTALYAKDFITYRLL